MTTAPFVHLHCHSHFSLLDGASRIDRLIAKAKASGMNALALTDHGNLYGALEFYQEARKHGINPILGYEAYIAPESRFDRDTTGAKESSYHLTLLAQNRVGFRNLIKMASKAYLEGFYHKPRIDKALLEQFHEGIICLSGCVSGEFSRSLLSGGESEENYARAMETAAWFHKLFGDRYFIEIQNNGLEMQRIAMEGSIEVANRMGIPLVATSDAHYVEREDAEAQDVLLCINTGKFRTDTNRMRMEGDQFFLRTPEEMYATFPGQEEAVGRSQEIADRVDIELDLTQRHFPTYTPPKNENSPDFLRRLCIEGLKQRYANRADRWQGEPGLSELSDVVMDRLDRELDVINQLGFANYFLIVWDFVRFASERGIPAGARGSGVGAIVSYALELSHVCPIEYDLLFERFLDPSRLEAPDIDIDFCKDRRGEVIQYVKDKYGSDNVAQIGTFGTLASRAAIRDVGRALGLPIPRVDSIVAMVPEELGIKLAGALEKSPDLKKSYDDDMEVRQLLDLAQEIEGLARNVGTHAAAVVIADKPLDEYVPLQRVSGKEEVITQWAMADVERAGLLKMDFLGLRNLTILAKAVDLVEQTTGQRINPYEFPLDDEETFALLCRGETKGIFQLESGGIRDLLQRMKPDHFLDIVATNALYRPGPLEGGMVDDYIAVKHGRKQPQYKHPVMEEVLQETHGVMVYQEQVMRILNRLGDIELPDAYKCIKAISKKKLEIIAKYRVEFIDGAAEKGLGKKDGAEVFALVEKFAGYGFNKSHSTAYALVAYMTAYLKAHYPVEFMAALLAGDIAGRNFKKKDSLVEHLDDCQRMQIEVVPPNVNQSFADFAVTDGTILFGMAAIKGCGFPAAEAIVAARKQGDPFRDLFDFCERIDPTVVNRTAIESLIKAGAMDDFGGSRAQWMAMLERAIQAGASMAADRRSGQKGLFNDEPDEAEPIVLPNISEWENRDLLLKEKEVLGFYLSSHPLAEHAEELATYCSHRCAETVALSNRTEVVVGGLLAAIKFTHTKNPRRGSTATRYAMFDLEDTSGILRCILWPDDFVNFGHYVSDDAVLVIRGTIDKRPGSDDVNLIVNELVPLAEAPSRFTSRLFLRIDEEKHGSRGLEQLHEILRGYPGSCELFFRIDLADGWKVQCKSESMRVELNGEMRRRVEELLGRENFRPVARAIPRKAPAPNGGRRQRAAAT